MTCRTSRGLMMLTATENTTQICENVLRWQELETQIESGTLTADDWCKLDLKVEKPLFGDPNNCIVRPYTKNIILGPEKSFKTSVTLRLMLGLSDGKAAFPQLPVARSWRVFYLHGELSPP